MPSGHDQMEESDLQVALALAAVTVSLTRALQRVAADEDPLTTVQRAMQLGLTRLRQTPDSERALAIYRFVLHALRDPEIIEQPDDE